MRDKGFMGSSVIVRMAKFVLLALYVLVGSVVVMVGAGIVVSIITLMAVSTGRADAVLGIVGIGVLTLAAIIAAAVSAKREEKRRKAKELAQLQKDEQARLLETERQAEEERRLEEAARLEEERKRKEARLQVERRTKEREEQERQRAEEIMRQNEEEVILLLEDGVVGNHRNWIRKNWPNEARDFTPWLGEHLELVSHCTRLDLHHLGTEVTAAGGRADIVAWESKSKSKVVIENQIEAANARHFQQLISYGEALQAKIRIWIAVHFGKKYRQLVTEQNRKNESKPDGAIYYLLRIDRNVDDDQPLLSLDLGPTKAQLERVLFSQDERNKRKMLIDEFWRQYGCRRTTRFSLDKHEDVYVSKSVDIGEAQIRVDVRRPDRWSKRSITIDSYANRLLADFPEANTRKDWWGYDERLRTLFDTLLDLRLSINLENLKSWDEIRKWFSHMEEKVRAASGYSSF